MKTESKFLSQCREAADKIGHPLTEHLTWTAKSKRVSMHEDDGVLHVEKNGLHVCFDIGQDLPLTEQNDRMTTVLKHLGLFEHPAVQKCCLWSAADIAAAESDDECPHDECPHCGHRL